MYIYNICINNCIFIRIKSENKFKKFRKSFSVETSSLILIQIVFFFVDLLKGKISPKVNYRSKNDRKSRYLATPIKLTIYLIYSHVTTATKAAISSLYDYKTNLFIMNKHRFTIQRWQLGPLSQNYMFYSKIISFVSEWKFMNCLSEDKELSRCVVNFLPYSNSAGFFFLGDQ